MLRSGDPIDSWVISDGIVGWVAHDDFKVFVDTVLSNPITVEDSKSAESSANSFFGF